MMLSFTKKKPALWAKVAFLFLWLSLISLKGNAQLFYSIQNYDPAVPATSGLLGTLFNPQLFKLENIPTTYYQNQNLYATVYLPYIEYEYNPDFPIEAWGPHYTTGIVLSSPKDISKELYAPIQVANAFVDNGTTFYRPFASIIPYDDNKFNFKGPFNTLTTLNSQPLEYGPPSDGIAGISTLESIQKFTKFTHEVLGWNGYDKNGDDYIYATIFNMIPDHPADYSDSQINIYTTQNDEYLISRNLIGHEMAHGIMDHLPAFAGQQFSTSMRELMEGFADIMGLSYYNWTTNPQKFAEPNWSIYPEVDNGENLYLSFYNQKAYLLPNTYLGTYYNITDNLLDYEIHDNGNILKFWFFLLNNYFHDHIDNIDTAPEYTTLPLIPNDRTATYKLALELVFRTFTEKVEVDTDYPKLRDKTLEMMEIMGYPPNSLPYVLVRNAWFAVGIGDEPDFYNANCGIIKSAESWDNGLVTFPAQEFTTAPGQQTSFGYKLVDCSTPGSVSTFEHLDEIQGGIEFWDAENDGIYGTENNLEKSKSAVSVHTFTIEAKNWYKNHFNHDGPDGTGLKDIDNVLGDASAPSNSYNPKENVFNYNYLQESCTIDEVGILYFVAANTNIKNEITDIEADYNHPEWQAIQRALGRIFALNIKNDFNKSLPIPQPSVWTLGGENNQNPKYTNFSNPLLSQQPKMYNGLNWNSVYPGQNFSVLSYMYYLLVHGTDEYGPQGYVNENNHAYFISAINNDLALQVLWKAYLQVPLYVNFEEFRLASLQQIIQQQGSKADYIALYDAWSAVMDLPDYAATLKHEPADDETIYPWAAKLGVEVEYPLLESSRIFEVSESATFNELVAPVYSFFNYTAPDMNTGMVYGRVNLLPGKTYFVRSHLYTSGNNKIGVAGGCDVSENPALCLSLQGKEKWTPIYTFHTAPIEMIEQDMSPAAGSTAPAWDTPFSWGSILGANGYLMKIGDDAGIVPMGSAQGTLALELPYDEDQALVYQNLALSSDKNYTYTLAAKAKLGSEEGAKGTLDPVLNYTLYVPLTPEEKVTFPDAYSTSSEPITFKTDIPKLQLENPADQTYVSPLSSVTINASPNEPRVDLFRGRVYYQQDGEQPNGIEDNDQPVRTIKIMDLPYIENGHSYGWTFSPKKNKKLPFIISEETGEMPNPKHFIVDKKLIPQPDILDFSCIKADSKLVLHWNEVPGAQGYKYVVTNANAPNVVLDEGIITNSLQSPAISGVSTFPGKYLWSVRAGYKNYKGEWEFGDYSLDSYLVIPPAPTNLSPNGGTVNFIPSTNNKIKFTWDAIPGVTNYFFTLNNSTVSVGNVTEFVKEGLDWETTYNWSVSADNPLDPENTAGCRNTSEGSFTTQKEPVKVIPELGFNFFIKDCNLFCLPDISYDLKVTAPNGDIVFQKLGMTSNANLVEYPFLQSAGAYSGQLPSPPQDGNYTLNFILTQVGKDVPKEAVWALQVRIMDMWNPLHNNGPAVELTANTDLGSFATTQGTIINLKFKYDNSTNNVIIQ